MERRSNSSSKVDHMKEEKKVMDQNKLNHLLNFLGKPGAVTEDLYLGSLGNAQDKKLLDEIGITHILTVANNIKPKFENEFKYEVINILDVCS